MVEICGKPFISHQLETIKKNGIVNVIICAGYLGYQIEDYIGDGNKFGLNVKYSYDGDTRLGTGGAIKNVLHLIDDVFFVIYGDSYLDVSYKSVMEFFLKNNKPGLMTVYKNNNKWDISNIVFKNGNIIEYNKKYLKKDMNYIDYGLGILKKEVFSDYNEYQIFDLSEIYRNLLNEGKLLGFEVMNRFYEIGTYNGIKETEKYITLLNKMKNK
jgi:NDP-sugar pyrophosphorylase family protein